MVPVPAAPQVTVTELALSTLVIVPPVTLQSQPLSPLPDWVV